MGLGFRLRVRVRLRLRLRLRLRVGVRPRVRLRLRLRLRLRASSPGGAVLASEEGLGRGGGDAGEVAAGHVGEGVVLVVVARVAEDPVPPGEE